MTISDHIKSQYFANEEQLIRLAPSQPPSLQPTKRKGTPWTDEEHNRFLEALEQYPAGPWKLISEHVATRTTRQTMTHAQRYREKIARRRRMLADSGLPVLVIGDEPSKSSSAANSSERHFVAGNSGSEDGDTRLGDVDITKADACGTVIMSNDDSMMGLYSSELDSIDLDDIQDETLLLSLMEAYDMLPFSEEDARWLAEHCNAISMEP